MAELTTTLELFLEAKMLFLEHVVPSLSPEKRTPERLPEIFHRFLQDGGFDGSLPLTFDPASEQPSLFTIFKEFPIVPVSVQLNPEETLDTKTDARILLKRYLLTRLSAYISIVADLNDQEHPQLPPRINTFLEHICSAYKAHADCCWYLTCKETPSLIDLGPPGVCGDDNTRRLLCKPTLERVNLNEYKHANLVVTISLEVPTLFAAFIHPVTRFLISFSFGSTSASPTNRFGQKYGMHRFCKVNFKIPQPSLEFVLQSPSLMSEDGPTDVQPFEVQKTTSILAAVLNGAIGEDSDLVRDQQDAERNHLYRQVERFKAMVGGQISFLGEEWGLVSCNIGGALNQSYVYTAEDPLTVMGWAFGSLEGNEEIGWGDYRSSTKYLPMKAFLRMGLLNSTSVDTKYSPKSAIITPDNVQQDGKSAHDGCGRISKGAAQKLWKGYKENWFEVQRVESSTTYLHKARKLIKDGFLSCSFKPPVSTHPTWPGEDLPDPKYLRGDFCPSTFQIRCRGYKGMLVVDPTLADSQIKLFESMKKFTTPEDSPDDVLDTVQLVGVSFHHDQPVRLSSQILFTLFANCRESCRDALKQVLEKYITDWATSAEVKIILAQLDDPSAKLQKDLWEKIFPVLCDLAVPFPLGSAAEVYGVADFTNSLDFSQIFFFSSSADEPLTTEVLVMKSPILNKSDMVAFKAIDVLGLRHLRDVLVFSAKDTNRCMPSSLVSGADLDGDHFILIWDERMVACFEDGVNNTEDEEVNDSDLGDGGGETPLIRHVDAGAAGVVTAQTHYANALEKLQEPLNPFHWCTLSHLLTFRRRLLEAYGPTDESDLFRKLSDLVDKTVIAPKHGSWVQWKDFLEGLAGALRDTKESQNEWYSSLFAKLIASMRGNPEAESQRCSCPKDLLQLGIDLMEREAKGRYFYEGVFLKDRRNDRWKLKLQNDDPDDFLCKIARVLVSGFGDDTKALAHELGVLKSGHNSGFYVEYLSFFLCGEAIFQRGVPTRLSRGMFSLPKLYVFNQEGEDVKIHPAFIAYLRALETKDFQDRVREFVVDHKADFSIQLCYLPQQIDKCYLPAGVQNPEDLETGFHEMDSTMEAEVITGLEDEEDGKLEFRLTRSDLHPGDLLAKGAVPTNLRERLVIKLIPQIEERSPVCCFLYDDDHDEDEFNRTILDFLAAIKPSLSLRNGTCTVFLKRYEELTLHGRWEEFFSRGKGFLAVVTLKRDFKTLTQSLLDLPWDELDWSGPLSAAPLSTAAVTTTSSTLNPSASSDSHVSSSPSPERGGFPNSISHSMGFSSNDDDEDSESLF